MSVERFHNPQFDPVLNEAYLFAGKELGLSIAPKENIALITPDQAQEIRAKEGETWGGGYDHQDNTAIVVQSNDPARPLTAAAKNLGSAVHEIAHTGTANESEHMFYREALPGIAEMKNLDRLSRLQRFRPAFKFTLERAGVRLWVPGNTRYLDAREAEGTAKHGAKDADTTQGMIAAVGVALTLQKSGLTSANLLDMSKRNGTTAYYAMKHSLNTLKPGLAKEVESMPESTEGIIQGAAIIQAEARKQDLLR